MDQDGIEIKEKGWRIEMLRVGFFQFAPKFGEVATNLSKVVLSRVVELTLTEYPAPFDSGLFHVHI